MGLVWWHKPAITALRQRQDCSRPARDREILLKWREVFMWVRSSEQLEQAHPESSVWAVSWKHTCLEVSGFPVAKVTRNFQYPGKALVQSAKVESSIVSHINTSLLKNGLNG